MKQRAVVAAVAVAAFAAGLVLGLQLDSLNKSPPVDAETRTTGYATTYTVKQVETVCFSRVQDCASLIAGLIDAASQRVYVMVYSFTSDELGAALMRAKNRGLDVKVVLETQQAEVQGSEYRKLMNAGVEVKLDSNPYLMHHKVAVIDGRIVVTGSYNWSAAAERNNDENIVVLVGGDVASLYEEEFMRIWSSS